MPLGAEKYQNGWREGIQENSQDKKGTGGKKKMKMKKIREENPTRLQFTILLPLKENIKTLLHICN